MCGIVAHIGSRDCVPILMEGLLRLGYRGYDSAGLTVVGRSGELHIRKTKGRVSDLAASLPARLQGSPGIAHTRWATHGEPSDANAHPHACGTLAIVHNGIIENAAELRTRLIADGAEFASETDSEILVHLIAAGDDMDLEEAVRQALGRVVGTYGIAVLDARQPDRIVAARNGSPIMLGIGDREMFVVSDVAGLVRYTRKVVHLDDGEVATIRANGFRTSRVDARRMIKTPSIADTDPGAYDAKGYAHLMRKEIYEQPQAMERALTGRLEDRFHTAHLGGLNLDARQLGEIRRVKILGCGSSYYAGALGAQLIEELARILADAESASEFRYRNPVVEPDTLYIAVSQSGETYDTLAAVQEVKRKGGRVLGVVNAVGSAIARECDGGIYLHAGPEVSVTSTKTFTVTAVVFALLALHLGRLRDLSHADGQRVVTGLRLLSGQITEIFAQEDRIARIAHELAYYPGIFFVGRARGWPVAREGAQKLKEVSYLHAQAYPAGEFKHVPSAMVGSALPSVAIVPDDELLDENISTLGEIHARGGRVIAVGHHGLDARLADEVFQVPKNEPELDPILLSVPLQLLACHAAMALRNDVAKPKNLF
jgi:glucosamine--fructose-6-phosphate aminotransferase (isomerizing)